MENKTPVSPAKKGQSADETETEGTGKPQKTLKQIFENILQDTYNAEKQLIKALPDMVKAAFNENLQDAFGNHLDQTKRHVERLDKVFGYLHIDSGNETCEAMEGLIRECKETIREYGESDVRDTALIINAQKIEHYEIAAYGSLCELADVLGLNKIADLLDRTLQEEKEADHMLTHIAREVNDEAYALSEDDGKLYRNGRF